ncbi:MAG: glycosyltransferase family 4 protein [Acidimicrobiales bacterium]
MRIGLVCPYSLTVPGGVQGQVLGLSRAMRRLGHDVRVLAPSDGPPPDTAVTTLGRSIPVAANGSVAPLAPGPATLMRTVQVLRDERFDVLHLHEPLVPGPTLTSILVKPAPLIGTFHAAGDRSAYRGVAPVARRLAGRLDLRCAVSDDARRFAGSALGGDYTVTFNGVEVDRFAAFAPWPTDGPTVFFVGRHERRKGLVVLLEAMRSLPAEIRLWVGGEGPETAALRSAAGDDARIEWLGRITDAEKAARLRGADIFCAPSLGGESFGVVLLEAMAAGTPVVASDLPGYRTAARPDVDALLVPPGNAQAFAGALERAFGDDDLVERLVASGRERAATFSMGRLATLYLNLYQTVMDID